MKSKKILISRTDSIGDVVLTLPLAGYLKQNYPGVKLGFLGRNYTQPIVKLATGVDEFFSWDEVANADSKTQAQFPQIPFHLTDSLMKSGGLM